MIIQPRPCHPLEAASRMLAMVGLDYPYELGTGNYHLAGVRGPWDCAGAICEAYKLTRHRPGFARGALPLNWDRFADVTDDINTNSMIKDALVGRDIFHFVPDGEPLEQGDVIAYPTIRIKDAEDGHVHVFIGHVQMALDPNGARAGGPYGRVKVAHSHGPNGRRPAVTIGFADVMDKHNHVWPKVHHKAWALRVVP